MNVMLRMSPNVKCLRRGTFLFPSLNRVLECFEASGTDVIHSPMNCREELFIRLIVSVTFNLASWCLDQCLYISYRLQYIWLPELYTKIKNSWILSNKTRVIKSSLINGEGKRKENILLKWRSSEGKKWKINEYW